MIFKFNVGLKTLLREDLSEPESYGDSVYKFKTLIGRNDFSFQFRIIIASYRRIGYNLNVLRQSACLVFNPTMVDQYAAAFNCTPGVGVRPWDGPNLKLFHFSLLWPELLVCCLAHRDSPGVFLLLRISVSYWAPRDLHRRAAYRICESSFLIHHSGYNDVFVCP